MKEFIIIFDYTANENVWDGVFFRMKELPSRPPHEGFESWHPGAPVGEWSLASGVYNWDCREASRKKGIAHPKFEQLPAIYCVEDSPISRSVQHQFNVTTEDCIQFIKARIEPKALAQAANEKPSWRELFRRWHPRHWWEHDGRYFCRDLSLLARLLKEAVGEWREERRNRKAATK